MRDAEAKYHYRILGVVYEKLGSCKNRDSECTLVYGGITEDVQLGFILITEDMQWGCILPKTCSWAVQCDASIVRYRT